MFIVDSNVQSKEKQSSEKTKKITGYFFKQSAFEFRNFNKGNELNLTHSSEAELHITCDITCIGLKQQDTQEISNRTLNVVTVEERTKKKLKFSSLNFFEVLKIVPSGIDNEHSKIRV